jgi:hypothetical protein
MPSLENVYEKFGAVAEAAQLLETQIGNTLLSMAVTERDLATWQNLTLAKKVFAEVDRKTLGQLMATFLKNGAVSPDLEQLLVSALEDRNRLNHAFYRSHNFHRNSERGRVIMLQDLDSMHGNIIAAYVAMMRLSGVDIEQIDTAPSPTRHLPLVVN